MKKNLVIFICLLTVSAICSAGEEQIKYKNALSSFREKYSEAADHKAFAQSWDGAWAWSAGKGSAQGAIDDAVAKCTKNLRSGQGPCLAVHVDNEWIPAAQLEKQKAAYYNGAQVNAERLGVLTLTGENIKKVISTSKGLLAVQFSSYDSGCGYCTFSNGPFEQLAQSYSGVMQFSRITWQPWRKMNNDIANYYSIYGLPALIVFNDGKEKFRIEGWTATLEKEIRDKLDACCKR